MARQVKTIVARHSIACRVSSVGDTLLSVCPQLVDEATRCTYKCTMSDRTILNMIFDENAKILYYIQNKSLIVIFK